MSLFASIAQPCESVEEGIRREIREESGIEVRSVQLLQSQPWPLGRGGGCELMLGCVAVAETENIQINDSDVEEVKWVSRDDVRRLLDESLNQLQSLGRRPPPSSTSTATSPPAAAADAMKVPGPYAIAHHLLQRFVRGEFDSLVSVRQESPQPQPQPVEKESTGKERVASNSSVVLSVSVILIGLFASEFWG